MKKQLTLALALATTLTFTACEEKKKQDGTTSSEPAAAAETQQTSQEAAEAADTKPPETEAEDTEADAVESEGLAVTAEAEEAEEEAKAAAAGTKAAKAEEVVKGTFTDTRDNKTYKTTKIGEQTWMAENLNFEVKDSKCYANAPASCYVYGRLYNWDMAKTACPKGWHLPNNAEWEILIVAVGGAETAGKYLKSTSSWINHGGKSGNGEDKFSFSALPGGEGGGNFSDVGSKGNWWSATAGVGLIDAYYRGMSSEGENVNFWTTLYAAGGFYSVRCIQN